MRPKVFFRIVTILSCLMLTTSCWDRVEIDQRGFVVGVAIDPDEHAKNSQKGTYQFVVPAGLKQNSRGASDSSQKAFFNLTSSEQSMSSLAGKIANLTSRSPYFEHLKLVIISNEVARSGSHMADILDFFLRNNEMRRGVQILISEGNAADMLKINANIEPMPVDYINSIAKNNMKTNFMLPQSRIGDVHEYLVKHRSFAIQKIKIENGSVNLQGAAIFDGHSKNFIGFLSGAETQGLNFITGDIKGGIVEAVINGSSVDYLIKQYKRKISLENTDPNHLKFHIQLLSEGTLDKSKANLDPLDATVSHNFEEKFQKEMVTAAMKTVKKLQQTYKKDALGLGAYLYQNHYQIWKKVQDNWEQGQNLFSQAEVDIEATAILRRVGNINEISKE
ncbi:Ger(x)C family spore germination protein [Paenibacillus aestuarii]|uniref:Ger(X)C family spore germination protein n=1 Tax=Paenibacillus aestuarii TaxID=516965 RepID=A0ABW0KAC4_9BACL|nr:Ger(x)C family spore germination protein [Paenibacillus aestuarii]